MPKFAVTMDVNVTETFVVEADTAEDATDVLHNAGGKLVSRYFIDSEVDGVAEAKPEQIAAAEMAELVTGTSAAPEADSHVLS